MSIYPLQVAISADGTAATGTSVSGAFPNPISPHSLVMGLVTFASGTTTGLTSVTDDKGNTYNNGQNAADATAVRAASSFYLQPINNGARIVTANLVRAAGFRRIILMEFGGASGTTSDGSAQSANTAGTVVVDAVNSGTVITTASGDVIWGASVATSGHIGIAAGTGYTLGVSGGPADTVPMICEFKLQAAASGVAATFTSLASGSRQLTFITTYKQAPIFSVKSDTSPQSEWTAAAGGNVNGNAGVPIEITRNIQQDVAFYDEATRVVRSDTQIQTETLQYAYPVPRFPFGQHVFQYFPSAYLKPNNVTQASMDSAVVSGWAMYKANYLINGLGGYYITGGQAPPSVATSEGQGYGMLLSVMMAGSDTAAQTIFNNIFAFGRAHPSTSSPYLMSYTIDADGSMPDPFPALDADLDMTLALLLADTQWGSTGTVNYKAQALLNIAAIKSVYLTSNFTLSGSGGQTVARSSDQMPDHFRAFLNYTADTTWTSVLNRSYQMIQYLQANYSTGINLLPDWITNIASTNVFPASGGQSGTDGSEAGEYSFNACRDPWRLTMDFLLYGDSRGASTAGGISYFFEGAASGTAISVIGERNLNGTIISEFNETSFQSPVMAGTMGTTGTVQQTWINNLWAYVTPATGEGYFDDSLNLLSMMAVSQNWIAPGVAGRVQGAVGPAINGTTSGSISLSFSSAVTSGDGVVGTVSFDGSTGATVASITDDKGNSYSTIDALEDVAHTQWGTTFYALNLTNKPTTVKVNFTAPCADSRITMTEYWGLMALDQHGALLNTTGSAASGAMTSPTVMPTQGAELVYGSAVGSTSTVGVLTGLNFFQGDSGAVSDALPLSSEYLMQAAASGVATTFTNNVSGGRQIVFVATFTTQPSVFISVTGNFGSYLEIQRGVKSDQATLDEVLFGVQRDNPARAEWNAGFRSDTSSPLESLTALRADHAPTDEVLAGRRGDAAVQAEVTAGRVGDASVQIEASAAMRADTAPVDEILRGVHGDTAIQDEIVAAMVTTGDTSVRIEFTANSIADTSPAAEVLAGVHADTSPQDEILRGVHGDTSAQIEVNAAALTIGNGAVQIEWFALARFDTSASAEFGAAVKGDTSPADEVLRMVRGDGALQNEVTHNVALDAGATLEIIAVAIGNTAAQAEVILHVTANDVGQLEIVSGLRADSAALLESTASQAFTTNTGFQIEIVRAVDRDSGAPLELGQSVAGITTIQIEETNSVNVVAGNSSIQFEFVLRVVGSKATGDLLLRSLGAGDKIIISTSSGDKLL